MPACSRSKAKNAQEAHEAIRPTQSSLKPELLPAAMPADSKLLYSLIWRRTLASQMQDAAFRQVRSRSRSPLCSQIMPPAQSCVFSAPWPRLSLSS